MSSPARLQYSPADLLARWMPSSTRAGVILDPDLAGTLRTFPAAGSSSLQPDDSFTSDFAPLPSSVDSSCLGVDGRQTGTVNGLSSAPTGSNGEYDSLADVEAEPQALPLVMKLEQLRKWQQHMQEQLKAHQLEELLHFQEEQHRLLGNINGSQQVKEDPAECSEMSEPDWGEDSLHGASLYKEIRRGGQKVEELSSADRHRQLSTVQDAAEEEDLWSARDDPENDPAETDFHKLTQQNRATATNDQSCELLNEVLHDRPIKPGIGVQKRTFEELLEEELRLEEQRLKVSKQQQPAREGAEAVLVAPKRTFLKRGEGLARFTKKSKASSRKTEKGPKLQPPARVISRSNSEPASIVKLNAHKIPRLPVQRKTAILNKENRLRGLRVPPPDIRAAPRTKILGGRQEQNMDGSECNRADSEGRTTKPHHLGQNRKTVGVSLQAVRSPAHIAQPNPVTKQVGRLDSPGPAAESDAPSKKSLDSKVALTKKRENSAEEVNVPSDSFELSFQEKLGRWACDQQQENMDLGEFELLEQAAEELSFSSNSSFVVKVLQMDRQRWHAARGLHQRRLSSTPIKSPPRGVLERCSSVGDSGGLACQSGSVNAEALGEPTRADELKRRIGVDEQNGEKEDNEPHSDVPSRSGSEFGDEEAAVKSTVFFPDRLSPPYDKRSYQDEDSFRDSASEGAPDDSTLIQDEDGGPGSVVFDDDDTWNDLEDAAAGPTKDTKEDGPVSKLTVRTGSPPEKPLVRKVAASQEADLPPASQLINRLFHSLKPKAQNAPLPPPHHHHPPTVTSVDKNPMEETGQQVQSRQLRERLAELEIEIERFKKENSALAKLRQENEKIQENLRRERSEFEQTKAEEAAKFEEYKKVETKKLQKERKLFETHVLATRALPDKKEREEMQVLKQQLNSVQEELRRREGRWTSTHSRLRQQIDSLSQESSSLRDEIRMLEKLRLSAWKKTPAATEKDSPRLFENHVQAGTKGVTFASPLDCRGSSSSSSSSPPQTSVAAGTRRPSGETSQAAAAGRKSSLRKPAGPGSCSSSVSSRRTDERSAPAIKSLEMPPQQEQTHNSPKRDAPPDEPGGSDAKEQESAKEMIPHPDGKVEKVLANGDHIIVFPNGTRKEVSADGESVKVTFFNGDTKQITADQRVTYYYADAQTTHITYPDGMEVLHFPNNQTEKHFPDGRKEITFPDQTVKNLFPSGREESVLTDGTIIQVNPDGTKEIHFNTGQKEIHTADYKRREYPDGTVKTVYTDGRQETRYPTGRVRIKDKDGNVVLDNMA